MSYRSTNQRPGGATRSVPTRIVLVASAAVLFATTTSGAEAARDGRSTYRPDPAGCLVGEPVTTCRPLPDVVSLVIRRRIAAAQAAHERADLADRRS